MCSDNVFLCFISSLVVLIVLDTLASRFSVSTVWKYRKNTLSVCSRAAGMPAKSEWEVLPRALGARRHGRHENTSSLIDGIQLCKHEHAAASYLKHKMHWASVDRWDSRVLYSKPASYINGSRRKKRLLRHICNFMCFWCQAFISRHKHTDATPTATSCKYRPWNSPQLCGCTSSRVVLSRSHRGGDINKKKKNQVYLENTKFMTASMPFRLFTFYPARF